MSAQSQFRATGKGGLEVETITLDQIAGCSVDLLKMDIEGAEYETLASASMRALANIRRAVVEYHPNGSIADCHLDRAGFILSSVRDDGNGYGIALWHQRCNENSQTIA
jgi:hypothetical protein